MCGSRKYPYPPCREGGVSILILQGAYGTPPPTPWNFHEFSTWVPLPLGNSISTNNKTFNKVIYYNPLGNVSNKIYNRRRCKATYFQKQLATLILIMRRTLFNRTLFMVIFNGSGSKLLGNERLRL